MNIWEESKRHILKEINLKDKSIVDIGCGNGWFLSWSSMYILKGIGIDPSPDQISIAKNKIKKPNIEFRLLGAENINNLNESFDLIFFFNSFHHIPEEIMHNALLQCSKSMKNNSIICIVEPLAQGSFFQFMKDIDDETKVRSAAYNSIIDCNKVNLKIVKEILFNEKKIFKDSQSCLHSLQLVDVKRSNYINKNKKEIIKKFHLLSDFNKDKKYEFSQPMRLNLLKLDTASI